MYFFPTRIAVLCFFLAHAASAEETAPSLDRLKSDSGDVVVHAIHHATFVMQWGGQSIYVDPVGGAARFRGFPKPDLILITDIHGDHLNADTVAGVVTASTKLIAPQAVVDRLPDSLKPRATALANGAGTTVLGIEVEAIPMYNLTPQRKNFHTKGRGNGYVVSLGGRRIYISGDTEDIPEMRALKDIDAAFVCMNLPYTMDVEQAASAVLEFEPKVVYPFHYRGGGGTLSDVGHFAKLVSKSEDIEVRQLNWYP